MIAKKDRITLPLDQRCLLLASYTAGRFWDQVKAFLPVVLYLVVFQTVVLGQGLGEVGFLVLGILTAVLGLTLFMEGVFLNFMPLGESLGIGLPMKWPLPLVLIFSLVLGAAATLAEPAVGALKAAGSTIHPWEAPLLYMILNPQSLSLVIAIALGVGVAVTLGMMRLLFGWTLKKLLMILFPPILVLTLISAFHPLVAPLVGLAWDSGGITTGPVTVPLVLALGIGVARISSKEEEDTGGFGIVTLASLIPVAAVLFLGWGLLFWQVPDLAGPGTPRDFFSEGNRSAALRVMGSEDSYRALAAKIGLHLSGADLSPPALENILTDPGQSGVAALLARQGMASFQAVVPLTLFLLLIYFMGIREKLRYLDEKILGIILAFLGMLLFSAGIETGLSKLGQQVGHNLSASFQKIELPERTQTWKDVSREDLRTVFDQDGKRQSFLLQETKGVVALIPFRPESYDETSQTYLHVPSLGPLFGTGVWGLVVVLLFGFIMGYGATLAEPALLAMSRTVEEVTVGVISRKRLTQVVALGVGAGMMLGLAKILWNLPLGFILPGIYGLLLIITLFSKEDFVNIAFDSAGVTTGPVTVPLVIIIGLSLGARVGVLDSFGVLACASAFPILFVLLLGLWTRWRAKKVTE